MAKKPTTSAAAQLLAAMTAAGLGDGEHATVMAGFYSGAAYTGAVTVHWADNAGHPDIVAVTVRLLNGARVLIPWHAVRAIEPTVPDAPSG